MEVLANLLPKVMGGELQLFHAKYNRNQGCGVGVGVARSRRFLVGVAIGFLKTLGVRVGFYVRLRKSN